MIFKARTFNNVIIWIHNLNGIACVVSEIRIRNMQWIRFYINNLFSCNVILKCRTWYVKAVRTWTLMNDILLTGIVREVTITNISSKVTYVNYILTRIICKIRILKTNLLVIWINCCTTTFCFITFKSTASKCIHSLSKVGWGICINGTSLFSSSVIYERNVSKISIFSINPNGTPIITSVIFESNINKSIVFRKDTWITACKSNCTATAIKIIVNSVIFKVWIADSKIDTRTIEIESTTSSAWVIGEITIIHN